MSQGKLRQNRLLWSIIIICSFIFCFFLITPIRRFFLSDLAAQSQNNEKSARESSPSISLIPVVAKTITPVNYARVFRNYTGTIVPQRNSELGFEIPGKLTVINVDQGNRVTKGMPLALLDTRSLKITQQELLAQRKQMVSQLQEMENGSRVETIATAQAQVRQLKTELKLAQEKSDRRKNLHAQGAIAQEQLDEASNEVATIQARLDQYRSQLDELLAGTRFEQIEGQKALIELQDLKIANLELEIQKAVLKAPFTGIISARLVDEGTIVQTGQTILKLVEDSQLEAHIGVPAQNAAQIDLGDIFPLKIDNRTYQAQVSSILPELDPSTRTLTIILKIQPGAEIELFSGQIATLQLTEKIQTTGYWLPITALVEGERGLWTCYVLGKQEDIRTEQQSVFKVEQKAVEILQIQSDRILVRGTLQPQDQVITDGIHRLVPGQLVTFEN
ncbi:RND family efflux transporter, MFP subunit [Xenococcus sp. PCC 7305]|uniref:efflux RND transporter periplasmic adaptor subunit n=1 Tax=Xenococcus sp. PCC 7305 TaxID=102125 RepID=UPI0002ACAF58|nr:efflux RND transporter periplasmic adaptor subunit [Xenococcus sp. PCC 7305]ELS01017.1 RND family efflux transporter, MFP subunit [Xenococcus sp. PCC 7305]